MQDKRHLCIWFSCTCISDCYRLCLILSCLVSWHNNNKLLVTLALTARLQRWNASFFLVCTAKIGSWSQAFLAEAMETGDKNRDRQHIQSVCIICEESLGKVNAKDVKLFQKGSLHKPYCLKAVITLKQVNTSVVKKNEES